MSGEQLDMGERASSTHLNPAPPADDARCLGREGRFVLDVQVLRVAGGGDEHAGKGGGRSNTERNDEARVRCATRYRAAG